MKTPSSRYESSARSYNPTPPPWVYPPSAQLHRVDTGGWVRLKGKRLFVSEALAGEFVALEPVAQHLLVSYRKMYVREIDPKKETSQELFCPISHLESLTPTA